MIVASSRHAVDRSSYGRAPCIALMLEACHKKGNETVQDTILFYVVKNTPANLFLFRGRSFQMPELTG